MTKVDKTEHIYLDEDNPSASTLHPGQGANAGTDTIHRTEDSQKVMDQALQALKGMNDSQRKRWLDYLMGVAAGSAIWNQGVDYSERNRASVKGHGNYAEELDHELDQIGFTSDVRAKCVRLFDDAVGNDGLREGIAELLGEPVYTLLFNEESMDTVELLASYNAYLLEQIALVERANAEMVEYIKESILRRNGARTENLDLQGVHRLWQTCESLDEFEAGLEQLQPAKPSRRRSTVEQYLNEADEANADCYYNKQHLGNRAMQNYVASLERTSQSRE